MTAQLANQPCPFCKKETLTLSETPVDIPYFGKVYVFSMQCSSCKAHKSDVESDEQKEPAQYTLEVEGTEALNVRVVKSSEATVSFKGIGDIEPGPASQGYLTNIEGLLVRMREQLEAMKKTEDDEELKKKIEKKISQINRIIAGKEKVTLAVKDPTGNSAIVSPEAKKKKI